MTDRYRGDTHQRVRELIDVCTRHCESLETLLTEPGNLGRRRGVVNKGLLQNRLLIETLNGKGNSKKRRREGKREEGKREAKGTRGKKEILYTISQIFTSSEIQSFIPESSKQDSSRHPLLCHQ